MATPVKFAGNTYFPQVPIPESVNITKVYVSEATLPKEKCDPDQFIGNGLLSFFTTFAIVLKATFPKLVSGHYVKYYLDAHVVVQI